MKKYILSSLLTATVLIFFTGCEEEFVPEISSDPPDIVVEGYIEAGEESIPPYVLLTRSLPYFSEISLNELDSLYVHDALVTVKQGDKTATLDEVCWNDFSPDEQELLKQVLGDLGIALENVPLNFCVYIDLEFTIEGEIGKTYDLKVEVEDKILTASTTIPEHVPLEYIVFQKPSGEVADTLLELRTFIKDPEELASFFRYFTAVDGAPLMAPFSSVFDDRLFNGKEFEFPLAKAEPLNEDIDPAEFGYFAVGDTVTLKWSTIDHEHFDFWNTLEFNRVNQGPFSSYTQVDFNIEGGIGIWGGYSSSYYTMVAEE